MNICTYGFVSKLRYTKRKKIALILVRIQAETDFFPSSTIVWNIDKI